MCVLDGTISDIKVVDVSDRSMDFSRPAQNVASTSWRHIVSESGTGPDGRWHGTADKHAAFRGAEGITQSARGKSPSYSCLVLLLESVTVPNSIEFCKVPALAQTVPAQSMQGSAG